MYYDKYIKYKKKYLTLKDLIIGGSKCIEYSQSESFINVLNKNNTVQLVSLPEGGADAFPAYGGYPTNKRAQSIFGNQFSSVLENLLNGNMIILNLQVTNSGDKHAIFLYFDNNTLELWNSNGLDMGEKSTEFIDEMIDYLMLYINNHKTSKKKIKFINSTININNVGEGNCDALALYYALLRSESYEAGEQIYCIDWNKKNIGLLNKAIVSKNIYNLKENIDNYFTF